jgi:hypothetical protein
MDACREMRMKMKKRVKKKRVKKRRIKRQTNTNCGIDFSI